MRDHIPPCQEVARRVSKQQFASVYGLKFPDWKVVTAEDLLEAYASTAHSSQQLNLTPSTCMKGMAKQNLIDDVHSILAVRSYFKDHGRPDDTRVARIILKDFIKVMDVLKLLATADLNFVD